MKHTQCVLTVFIAAVCASAVGGSTPAEVKKDSASIEVALPTLRIDHKTAQEAFRIAIGDLMGNVVLFEDGAYLRMVLLGLVGMRFDTDGVRFQPCVPEGISQVALRNLQYRKMQLDVTLRGTGAKVQKCLVNDEESTDGFLAAREEGRREVTIILNEQ